MMAEPAFPTHDALTQKLTDARGMARIPEGKGGHVFIDGTLYRIFDISDHINGEGAFGFGVNEKELIHLCRHIDVAALGFKGLRTTTIAPLTQLKRLKYLSLWWVQKLVDLSPLSEMNLECLVLDDIRNANDISALARISDLKGLTIAGGMNSTQLIDTLEPLTRLSDLSELRLSAIKLGDDTLRPLARCNALSDLHLPNTFPTEDYAYLRAKCADLRCDDLVAYQSSGSISRSREVMVTGRRKPFLDAKKDEQRLAGYKAKFDALVTEFQLSTND